MACTTAIGTGALDSEKPRLRTHTAMTLAGRTGRRARTRPVAMAEKPAGEEDDDFGWLEEAQLGEKPEAGEGAQAAGSGSEDEAYLDGAVGAKRRRRGGDPWWRERDVDGGARDRRDVLLPRDPATP